MNQGAPNPGASLSSAISVAYRKNADKVSRSFQTQFMKKHSQIILMVFAEVTEFYFAHLPPKLVFMANSSSGQAQNPPFVNAAQAAEQRSHRSRKNRPAETSEETGHSLERQMTSLAMKPQGPRQGPSIASTIKTNRNIAPLSFLFSFQKYSESILAFAAGPKAMMHIWIMLRKTTTSHYAISHGQFKMAWTGSALSAI